MPSLRQARVAEMIKRDLSEILQREMRDPRLAMVSVTNVEVSRDFTFAKVFISVIGDAQEKAEALRALQGASGFLRGQLGRLLDLRSVPQLAFRYDTGIEKGARMFELLREEEKTFAAETPTEGNEGGIEGEAVVADQVGDADDEPFGGDVDELDDEGVENDENGHADAETEREEAGK